MKGGYWIVLAGCALALAVWVAVELDSGGVHPATTTPRRPPVTSADEALARAGGAAPAPGAALGAAGDGAADALFDRPETSPLRAALDAGDFDEPALDPLPAETLEAPLLEGGPEAASEPAPDLARRHDGDLSRAALKSEHLRDRTRKSVGGTSLRDYSSTAKPGRKLGGLAKGPHLRDRSREGLPGGDLRDLADAEPGTLGERSLGSDDLGSLSRREGENGDLADRSGR